MAKNNRKFMTELSAKYNVPFQPIKWSASNTNRISVALIGGKEYNKLADTNNEKLEEIFKNASMGIVTDNSIVVKGNNLVINGRYHDMLEMFRGVSVKKVLRYLDNAKRDKIYYDVCEWLMNDVNRREYLKTIEGNDFWGDYLRLEHYFRTTERYASLGDLFETWEIMAQELAEQEGVGV